MKVDVAEKETFLLRIKTSMKKMGMTLHFKSDTSNIGRIDILLHPAKSVWYRRPLVGLPVASIFN